MSVAGAEGLFDARPSLMHMAYEDARERHAAFVETDIRTIEGRKENKSLHNDSEGTSPRSERTERRPRG